MLHQRNHLFGRKKVIATFDPKGEPEKMKIHDEEDMDFEGSYVIYDERLQRFIGIVRRGRFYKEPSPGPERSRLVFFPAGQS